MCKFKPTKEELKDMQKTSTTKLYCKESYCTRIVARRCDYCHARLCRMHTTRSEGSDRCFSCSMEYTKQLIKEIDEREKKRQEASCINTK